MIGADFMPFLFASLRPSLLLQDAALGTLPRALGAPSLAGTAGTRTGFSSSLGAGSPPRLHPLAATGGSGAGALGSTSSSLGRPAPAALLSSSAVLPVAVAGIGAGPGAGGPLAAATVGGRGGAASRTVLYGEPPPGLAGGSAAAGAAAAVASAAALEVSAGGGGSGGSGDAAASAAASAAAAAAAGRVRVRSGFYAGALVSDAAFKLLSIGEAESRRIYDRRSREAAGGSGVVQAVGTNAAAESGAAIQLGDAEGHAASRAASVRPTGEVQTFIESLRLPLSSLEAVAHGDFVYLMPIRARGRHGVTSTSGAVVGHENAYDLRVVDHRHTDAGDHFTLSSAGLVRYHGAESEFSPLPTVEREYRLFHSVCRIPTFARFKIWKSFTVWKRAVRGARVQQLQ